jgi:hypothetical protein
MVISVNTSESVRFVGTVIAEAAVKRPAPTLWLIWRDTNGAIGEWPIEGMTVSELAILIDDVEEVDLDDPTHHSGTYEWTYAWFDNHLNLAN